MAKTRITIAKSKPRKAAAKKAKSAKRTARPKAGKIVAKLKARKPAAKKAKATKRAASPAARKPAKKTAARKSAKKSTAVVSPPAALPKALRLTFSYQGDKVKLISRQQVAMTVPPSDPLKGYDKHKGFWAELKSDQDETLFRRVLHNPTRNDAEVFPHDPDESISREPAPKRTGVFVVVVPDTDKGHVVTLSRSSGPANINAEAAPKGMAAVRSLATGPAIEIARFKLKQ
jgi:hypothetical protein